MVTYWDTNRMSVLPHVLIKHYLWKLAKIEKTPIYICELSNVFLI
jgi:hypothetical protein